MIFSCKNFSQEIILSKKQAVQVVQDIVAGEECKKEVVLLESILKKTESSAKEKDQIIKSVESENKKLLSNDELRIEQLTAKDAIIHAHKKQLKRSNTNSLLLKITSIAGFILSGFLLLTN